MGFTDGLERRILIVILSETIVTLGPNLGFDVGELRHQSLELGLHHHTHALA